MPIVRSSSSIRQPPPCTMIGFMPTSRSSATSRAKPSFEHRIRHRAAAEADDQRRRVERPDERQRLGEDPRLLQRRHGSGPDHEARRRNSVRFVFRKAGLTRSLQGVARTAAHGGLPTVAGRRDVIAGMIPGTRLRIAVTARAGGARHRREPRQMLAVVPAIELRLALRQHVGLDDVMERGRDAARTRRADRRIGSRLASTPGAPAATAARARRSIAGSGRRAIGRDRNKGSTRPTRALRRDRDCSAGSGTPTPHATRRSGRTGAAGPPSP